MDPRTDAYSPAGYAGESTLNASGVSWGAIFAGAAGAAGLSLILLILGTGLGFSWISPWAREGMSASTFSFTTIAWITFTSLVASGIGGYIAGRLRVKWAGLHNDEVFFRDSAHGFLAWAVATLATAMLLTSVIGSIVGSGVKAGAQLMNGAATVAGTAGAGMANKNPATGKNHELINYYVDSLFRASGSDTNRATNSPDATPESAADMNGAKGSAAPAAVSVNDWQQLPPQKKTEVSRIVMHAVAEGGALPAADRSYIASLIAQRSNISQQEAEQRITTMFGELQSKLEEVKTTAKEAADKARKATAYASLWFFISLLIGAFVASLAAIFGGRQRDLY